ncbi:MAG: ATP synthase F1 subunit gamma [Nitrospirae bacterium]|nr:ATP synthase F1 subunit gamma [Nitrospirota bacterium]
MPKSPKFIRRRITSVRKTQQITKAMKMVAAAKLRRAQERILKYRPYAGDIESLFLRLVIRMRREAASLRSGQAPTLPVWATEAVPGSQPAVLITVASERGLCGSFNTNLLRQVERWARARTAATSFVTVGRKSRDYLTRRKFSVTRSFSSVIPAFEEWIPEIRSEALTALSRDGATVFLAYNSLITLTSQKPLIRPLLPVAVPEGFSLEPSLSWISEPDLFSLAEQVLPLYLESQIRKTLYESEAGEHSARMSAMENATKSAREMIDKLTLEMNKARQAAITKELMDIVNGAEALRG